MGDFTYIGSVIGMLQQMIGSLIGSVILTVYVIFSEYKYSKVKACVMGTGFFTVIFLLDNIFWIIMSGFAKNSAANYTQLIGIAASKSIMIAAIIFFKVMGNGRQTERKAAKWRYSYLLTVAASVLFVMLVITYQFEHAGVAYKLTILILLRVFYVVYLISAYMYERKQSERIRQAEEAMKRHETDIYLESVENSYQRTRELWHDLKNHINLMQVLIHEQKYEELKDYLRIFNEDVDTLTLPMKSGNVVVDALLSDKLGRAKREGIAVSLALCDLTGLKIKSDEICGLFGNLLDNALEANREVKNGKFMEITCSEQQDCYYFRIRNRMVAVDDDTEATLKTAKTDKKNQVGHGLGLRSIERIVHGCGGQLSWKVTTIYLR